MGDKESKPKQTKQGIAKEKNEKRFIDKYSTMEEIQQKLREAGLESSNLVIGIDYTKSNTWTGKKTFNGNFLHMINPQTPIYNPYQRVIDSIGRALEVFDDDRYIPCYGFGDANTTSKSVFSLKPNEAPCCGVLEVLQIYNSITPSIQLSGPTNFAPIIDKAVEIVKKTGSYHILIIIADGQVDNVKDTVRSIVEASKHALSIICVGVGDGPFDMMEKFDDNLTESKFDNFQFVNYFDIINRVNENQDVIFAVNALQEIPGQYKYIKEHDML
ncbi:Uncharacterized protein QTN25_009291 [Entamoeba marina]